MKLFGQVDLRVALVVAGGVIGIVTTVWHAASTSGEDRLRISVLEKKMERLEDLPSQVQRLADAMERMAPPQPMVRPASGKR
jgi:hypothetical protein